MKNVSHIKMHEETKRQYSKPKNVLTFFLALQEDISKCENSSQSSYLKLYLLVS